ALHDAERVPQCLGAIAGHDTVFLAVASTSHARDLHRRLARLV
ncbi:MAG: hypothetical protein KDA25_13110, partial [Phycisphaerales bacterium]|nr:hypothetical protein [Phycisphaerales bacterium]